MELVRLIAIQENRSKIKVSWELTSDAVLVKSKTRVKNKERNLKWQGNFSTKIGLGYWYAIIWITWVVLDET